MIIEWFKNNDMTVNPDKFQSMIICSKKSISYKPVLKSNEAEKITPASSVVLLTSKLMIDSIVFSSFIYR